MKSNQAIINLRLANIKQGLDHAEKYLGNINKMLSEKEINAEEIQREIEEVQCFLQWIREQ